MAANTIDIPDADRFQSELRGVARLIVGGGVDAVTPANICAAVGISQPELDNSFRTSGAAVAALEDSVRAAHRARIGATLHRRRSINGSLYAALAAFVDTVEERLLEHMAIQVLLSRTTRPGQVGQDRLQADLLGDITGLLTTVGSTHDTTWDRPVETLARLTMATLNGLIFDLAARRSPDDTRQLLRTYAYQLSAYATRNSRKGPARAALVPDPSTRR